LIDKNYELTESIECTTVKTNQFGNVLSDEQYNTHLYTKRLVKTQGMRMVKQKRFMEILLVTVKSNVDLQIVYQLTSSTGKDGITKDKNGKVLTIKTIASRLGVTDRKVRGVIKILEDEKLLKRVNKIIYINPFIQLPYNNNKDYNHILQLQWLHEFKYSIEELTNIHITEMQTKVVKNDR